MKKRMHTAVVSSVLCASLVCVPARVGAGTFTGGATEWTQAANMVQLMEHTVNLIQMVVMMQRQVRYMAQHARSMSSPQDFLNVMNGVSGMLGQLRGILFAGQSVVTRWKSTHQGSKDLSQWYASPADAYRSIDESTRQSVLRAMQTLDVQANSSDGWPKDQSILKQLASKAQDADGQLKATQVTNDLLLELIRQLHLLRGVQIAHAEMMGYYVSGETQRRQFDDKHRRDKLYRYTGQYRGPGTVDITTSTW